jgi:mono/diheme cytochrome c family protein
MRPAVLAGLAIAAAAAFALSPLLAKEEAGLLPYTDAKVVAEGRAIYADHCAACHGANLEGQPDWRQADAHGYLPAPPHDETGHTWHHPDALLIDITTRGTEAVVGRGYRSNMGGFGGILSEDEILAVLAFIKSTWPPRIIARHDRLNADAEAFGR